MHYSCFVVLGTGRLAFQCGGYLKETHSADVIVYDVNKNPSEYLKNNCKKLELEYHFGKKHELIDFLSAIKEKALIISAYNPHIIPAHILDMPNISAINVHHSLLPAHPGRNAEAWAIYEMDEYSGITWHILSEKVDKGAIIAQEKIKLDDNMTALKLLMIQNEKAFSSFKGFIGSFLNGSCISVQQNVESTTVFHYSKDRPNGGELNLNWSADKISAFLRAYDYSIYNIMGKPHLIYEGTTYQWKRYKLIHCDQCKKTVNVQNGNMLIKEGETEIHLNQLSPCPDI